MKKNLFTRILAGVLAAVFALPLAACSEEEVRNRDDRYTNEEDTRELDSILGSHEKTGSASDRLSDGTEPLFKDGTTIEIAIASNSSWPYDETWKVWDYFEEATGATFDIHAIPSTDFNTKTLLMLASPETLPDLIYFNSKQQSSEYANVGALIELTDENAPNMFAYLDTLPTAQRDNAITQVKYADGRIYTAPVIGTETVMNVRSWLYRKDILEKHGIAVPTTEDELYSSSKQLKTIYPDSYPFCFRGGINQINVMAPMWKNDFNINSYYDYQTSEWKYGAQDTETMTHIISFFNKMRNEGLVPPDYLDIDSKTWEELIATDRGFIMTDFLVRIDYFNKSYRENNPQFTLAAMAPPRGATAGGQSKISKININQMGYGVCNTGDSKQIRNAIKVIDWMYTDYAEQLLSWGKEGETYVQSDGKKDIIKGEYDTAVSLYGFASNGTMQRIDPESYEDGYSDEQNAQGRVCLNYLETYANPIYWLSGESEEYRTLCLDIDEYTNETVEAFLLGVKPMSEWDSFQRNLIDMGVEDLIAMQETLISNMGY